MFLSYWFPPMGGAGTQRVAKACKYLPSLGWTPLVVAATPSPDEHAPALDPSLLRELTDVEVVHVNAGKTRPVRALLDRARFRLGMDAWVDRATPIARELATRREVRALVTSLSPFAGWRLGGALARDPGIPWILDLRDPWALDGWRSWPTPLHAHWDLRQMKQALRSAQAVIANTPEAGREYARLGVSQDRLAVIPNGFDEEDLGVPSSVRAPGERFVLLHIGTFHSAELPAGLSRNGGLRWRHRQVEALGRTGHYLIRALARLRARAPELAAGLELRLLGHVHPSHARLASSLGVQDMLVCLGYVGHDEAMREMSRASAVFVPLHGVPRDERALVVPGKLYEALAGGRPVLAALPPGDGADLVRTVSGGVVVPPCDEQALAQALETLVRGSRQASAGPGTDLEALAPFTRRALAARLAAVLARTLAGESLADLGDPWQASAALARRSLDVGSGEARQR
jgi:glycosyltransferase involved in cell wall biosynthesis